MASGISSPGRGTGAASAWRWWPPAPAVRPMAVLVRATDQVWLYVEVDGKPYYGPNGKFLAAGDEDGYVGTTIRITTGKPAATLVSTDGVHYAPMASIKPKEWKST